MSLTDNKIAADILAWFGNVSSSVLLIYSNKILMSSTVGYGFRFATTLCALHYLTCTLGTFTLKRTGHIKNTSIAFKDLVIFTAAANLSIVSLNLSLMLNPVGFYQIAKLCIIPCSCLVEAFWLKRRFTPPVVASVLIVLLGVAIVTVTDLSVKSNLLGAFVAALSVASSTLQQIFCRTMQQRNKLAFLEFLSHTAPAQGWTLILVGPFMDYVVGGSWLLDYRMTAGASVALLVSCSIAIAVNVSQFACLGRFQAVSFQVLGHTKTVLVLLGGWALLGDKITGLQLLGMVVAVAGMVLYGYLTRVRIAKEAAEREQITGRDNSRTSKKNEANAAKKSVEIDEEAGVGHPDGRLPSPKEDGRIMITSHTSQRRSPATKLTGNL